MTKKYQVLTAKSITDATSRLIKFTDGWDDDPSRIFWFRGETNSRDFRLLPRAYRSLRKTRRGLTKHLPYNETSTVVQFAQLASAVANVSDPYKWETYYLAQHHGIPTRLIDWTDNFATSLFFAFDKWNGRSTPCIWILRPTALNKVFLDWEGLLAPENYPELDLWIHDKIAGRDTMRTSDSLNYVYDNDWPLAIYPKKSNLRISGQHGVFTIHGRRREPLDELIAIKGADQGELLAKIELKGFDRKRVLRELSLVGIRRRTIFPDLDNLVEDIRHENYF